MANPWFRMYAEFAHDPKVQMMTEVMQRRYIMLMCMRCSNALVTLQDEEIAFHLRIDAPQLAETKALFVAKGFIDDAWNLLNWEKRQFASDSSAQRVKEHRERKKAAVKAASNDDVTLLQQKSNALDTDTDTEKEIHRSPDGADDLRRCPVGTLVDLYHQLMPNNPQLRVLNETRRRMIRARWQEAAALDCEPFGYTTRSAGLEAWKNFFAVCAESKFLTGRAPAAPGKPPFVADIDFLFSASGFAKTLENKYHRDAA
jgi:hypothetical protein